MVQPAGLRFGDGYWPAATEIYVQWAKYAPKGGKYSRNLTNSEIIFCLYKTKEQSGTFFSTNVPIRFVSHTTKSLIHDNSHFFVARCANFWQ